MDKEMLLKALEQDLLIATSAEIRCDENSESDNANYWRGKGVALKTAIGLVKLLGNGSNV